LGLVIYAFGSALQGAALAIGPQSLLTCFESLTLVTNAMLAPCFLGERVGWKEVVSTVLIITGASLAVVFGPQVTATYTVPELIALYGGFAFIVFSIITISMGFISYTGLKVRDAASPPTFSVVLMSFVCVYSPLTLSHPSHCTRAADAPVP
jgi:hypothetical protein